VRFLIVLSVFFFFVACSTKEYVSKEAQIVTIKSPKLKFNDIGYVLHNGQSVELQLYSAGTTVEDITINHLVCIEAGCMSKSAFNEEYLSAAYEDDLLKNLLMKKPIFGGKNLKKRDNGFEQHLVTKAYDITYRVGRDSLYFKDTKNRILIKLKSINRQKGNK